MDCDSVADFCSAVRGGGRAILLVRHAERGKIDPKDPTFGDSLPITEEGRRTARRLGEMLADCGADALESVRFVSSPLLRTRMTAAEIAAGMGLGGRDIPAYGCLGNESFYYNNTSKVLEAFTPPENFFPACFRYMDEGSLDGFNPLAEATDAMEKWLFEQTGNARVLIAATHDLYIAAFLAARNAYTERSRETWPRFLDAAAIYLEGGSGQPLRAARYALVRTGLSDRITGIPSAAV